MLIGLAHWVSFRVSFVWVGMGGHGAFAFRSKSVDFVCIFEGGSCCITLGNGALLFSCYSTSGDNLVYYRQNNFRLA